MKEKKVYTLEITHLYIHVKPQVCVNQKLKTPKGAKSHQHSYYQLIK